MSDTELHDCRNPLCDFKIAGSAAYCCGGCATAHEHGFEIHHNGSLGHGSGCLRRLSELTVEDTPLFDLGERPNRIRPYAFVRFGIPMSITCPTCLRTSWNINDIRERYCGACGYHDGSLTK